MMASVFFILVVLLIYYFEIKWRKKHNKPLNKGKPIYGGQYIVFWVLGSVFVMVVSFSIALFLEKYWDPILINSYLIFEHILRGIYIGYVSSEPDILRTYLLTGPISTNNNLTVSEKAFVDSVVQYIENHKTVPYEEIIRTDVAVISLLSLYRLQILIVTALALIFGRKFIYAPFFEMTKTEGFAVHRFSLLLQIGVSALFIFGWIWFIFVVPMHSIDCPTRAMSFWCSNLGAKSTPYIKFPTLLLFYWMFLLILINAMTQAILNELGYVKHKEGDD
ncbi:MAG: hypothetical protein Q4C79_07940 [Neisseria sp.]|uniref:hypothetical protein n=1 Tax=Neisseria sp. TaxID=192066 RepID=UPI0026DAF4D7|nr:hypothetical protein [Neisseria sp.]MDO4248869.1 hypothetical protein [Neisseria sp.]